MTYDATSKKVLLFGGFSGSGYLNDTWTFDGATWTKIETGTAPSARANAQMAYDRHVRKVILFGGYDGHKDLGDTWLWDGTTSTWTQATPAHSPKAVTGPMLFTDFDGRVDEFGGFDGNLYQGTMWRWNDSDWRQLRPNTLPFARSSSAVGVNYITKQIVLFGGLGDVNPVNTWTYDGHNWTLESPATQPPWVYGGSAVFDQNLESVILFGGGSGGIDQDTTWSWTGSNWEQLLPCPITGPARRRRDRLRSQPRSNHRLRRTKPRSAGRRHLGTLALRRRSKSRRARRRNLSRRRRCSQSNARRFGFGDARRRPDRYPKG